MAIANPPLFLETGSPGDWTAYAAATANMDYISDFKFEIIGVQDDTNPLFQIGEYLRVDGETPDEVVGTVTSVFFDDINTEIEIEEVIAETTTAAAKRYPRWIVIGEHRYLVYSSLEERRLIESMMQANDNQVMAEDDPEEARKMVVKIVKRSKKGRIKIGK